MKVAILSYFYPNVSYGGSSFSVFNLANALSRYAEVTLFVPNTNMERLQGLVQGASLAPAPLVNLPLLRSLSFMATLGAKLRGQRFDLVHSYEGAGIFLKKVSVETFQHRPQELATRLHSLPHQVTLRRASHVIAISQRARQELLRVGFSEDKVTVVDLGVDTEVFRFGAGDPGGLRQSLGLDTQEDKVVLHVNSEASRRKNLPLMLKTMSYLKTRNVKAKLVIIGPRQGEGPALNQAEALGLAGDIRYVYDVPQRDMPSYYSAADFLAVPSLKEGFGFPLLESVAVGKPFVSMDVGIAPTLAAEGFGLVASSGAEFMESCRLMAENPLGVGEAGYAFVRQHYSWDACACKTLEVYHKALSST